jgi:hypothetical protein
MGPESIPKSMKNRYKFHARKSDVKNIEKHQQWTRKGGRNERNTYRKEMGKKVEKTNPGLVEGLGAASCLWRRLTIQRIV